MIVRQARMKANPDIPNEIRHGNFGYLLGWLQKNIYQPGSKFTASELLERVTGEALTIEPYVHYLKDKFGGIYGF